MLTHPPKWNGEFEIVVENGECASSNHRHCISFTFQTFCFILPIIITNQKNTKKEARIPGVSFVTSGTVLFVYRTKHQPTQYQNVLLVMVSEESSSETAPSSDLFNISSSHSSSSSSAESNFRELDDAFLQTQTRIWLGEVLQIRLDEQLIISELLADGELLFQVSKVVWKLLRAKHTELRHLKAYKNQPFASKKISRRYRPYSNVDSFLKICNILELTGVDLFTPSDVVERRNTRRVCMCIRSFSKRSRSMNINVPDFDNVTCMVAMPKDMVGYIRRSIELSHSILTDSSSCYYLQKHARGKSRQGYSVTGFTRDNNAYSDQSEDTENKHTVLQFDDLHTNNLYSYSSEINYDRESPMDESGSMTEDLDQLDIQNQLRNDFELLCSMESLQHHCSENLEHDCKLTWSSCPPCGDLHIDLIDMKSHLDTRVEYVQESRRIMDFDYFENVSLSSNVSIIETPMNDKTPGRRDASSLIKDGKDPHLFDEDISIPNVYQSASSHGSNPTPQTTENGKCSEIDDNMEVLQVVGKNCHSREALNLGDQFDAENNVQNIKCFKLHIDQNDHWKEEYESQGIIKCTEMPYGIISNARYSYLVKKLEETEGSLCSPDRYLYSTNSSDRVVPRSSDISSTSLKKFLAYEERESQVGLKCLDNAGCYQSEEFLSYQSCYLPESCKWDQKGKCAMTSCRDKGDKSSCFSEDGSYEETTPCKQKASEILMSKIILSCVPNEEDIVNEALNLGTDGKELNNDCLALASNALGVDDSEKCPTLGDDTNGLCGKGITNQDIGCRGQRVPDKITNPAVFPSNSDEDQSRTESYVTNQSSKLECYGGHKACQYEKDPVYHSEHTRVMHVKEEIKPEDENVYFKENLVEAEEGNTESPKGKSQKRLLLRSVLGGAAAFGLLFMILHLRRNGREKGAQPSMASSHKDKEKIQKKSTRKVKRTSTTKGIYPAEKLKLK
ncbi:hypothetical protein VNO77_00694 [Canavalia gladiata]|uniref:Protein OPAQUE10 n=1 Tax=Canavalia gladiata TaxID=3824 RepID=A0AAN9MQI3_CANGL